MMAVRKLFGFSLLACLPQLLQAQTTVTLTVSANPSILGAPVVLTATVTPNTAFGRVTFYDGVTVLGDALITGTANITTRLLASGSHKLKAYYAGDGVNPAVPSNVVTQTVNAKPSSGAFAQGPILNAFSSVAADFNGDGIADIALGVSDFGFLIVMFGNGDGTFRNGAMDSSLSVAPVGVGDFNSDGNLDLVVVDVFTGKLSILPGKGNGTFQPPVLVATLSSFAVAVADFNGDGKPDLAIGNSATGVLILLGKGDGTFQPAVTYPATFQTGAGAFSVRVGDFNGDGKADLVTANGASSIVSVLLGNGDGTFQLPVVAPVPALSSPMESDGMVVGDFNKDGKADVATVSRSSSLVSILLGNGDGTFQRAATYPSISLPNSVTTGDFNGDGNPDLAIGSEFNLSILMGNGDGTFQAPITTAISRALGLYAAEFNGDGKTDLVTSGSVLLGTTASLTLVGGTPQSAMIGTAFSAPLQVMLRDSGNPVSGATVTFSPSGVIGVPGAVLSSTTALTDASGIAQVTATANLLAGSYVVSASYQGLTVSFSLTNFGSPGRIAATGGTPQFAAVGAAFGSPLQVTVRDSAGNPVSGAPVTFTAPASGATAMLSSATAVTDANGVASATATANGTPGSYLVTARVGALATSFVLTNLSAGRSNLALAPATATQSSTLPGYPTAGAGAAMDGNTDGNFFNGSVTATNLDMNAWWQVDLGGLAIVNSIVVWNRTDCCGPRLSDYWVFVSNTPFLPTDTPATLQNRVGTFARHQTTAPNPFTIFVAGSILGRYVRVQLTGADYLSLAEVQVIGTTAPASNNLALGKPATQSSTLPGYPTAGAASAVDGNTEGNFSVGSVTATNLDTNAWWQVDLGTLAVVSSVTVWNRTDCCSTRLSDYWVFISDTPFLPTDTPATLQGRAGTFSSHQAGSVNPSTVIAAGAVGRYVRVQLTGANYLSLAEVQVFGGPLAAGPNLAQGKAATQSSTFPGYPSDGASAAVDGNTDGNFLNGSVTATNLDSNAWWQVDLGASAAVGSVVVWNRTDCCGTRLSDYWVFVSDTPFGAGDTPATLQGRAGTFSSHQTSAPNPSSVIAAGGAQGRYVRVQLTGTNYLSLAEVQVVGQ
jgi:hypothetical protein